MSGSLLQRTGSDVTRVFKSVCRVAAAVLLMSAYATGGQQTLSSHVLLATVTDTGDRPLYALGPIEGIRIRRLIDRVAAYEVPARAAQPIDFNAGSAIAHPIEAEPFEAIDDDHVPAPPISSPGQPELAGVH